MSDIIEAIKAINPEEAVTEEELDQQIHGKEN